MAGETPNLFDMGMAGLGGTIAVVGAGEIVAGTIIGGAVRATVGIFGDLGFQMGFNFVDIGPIIAPARPNTLPTSPSPTHSSCVL